MADIERFVDTASSGGDGTTRGHSGGTAAYASLSSCEANEATDLSAATGSSETFRARCAGSTADTTSVIWDGFTVDATYFCTIEGDDAATDSDGAHNRVWSTSHYRIVINNDYCLDVQNDYTVVKNIQFQQTGTFARSSLMFTGVTNGTCEGTLNRMDSTNASAECVVFATVSGSFYFSNNVFFSTGSGGAGTACLLNGAGLDIYFYHNTIEGFATGYGSSYQTTHGKNNLWQNCTSDVDATDDFDPADTDYNVTDAATFTPGSNNKTSTTVTFTSVESDYHTTDTDAEVSNPLDSDADYPISVDFDGETRDASTVWAGADEYVSGGGGGADLVPSTGSLSLLGVGL